MSANKIVISGRLKQITDNGLEIKIQCDFTLTVSDGENELDMSVHCSNSELSKHMVHSTETGDELTVIGLLTGTDKIYALAVVTADNEVYPTMYGKDYALNQIDNIIRLNKEYRPRTNAEIDPEGVWL